MFSKQCIRILNKLNRKKKKKIVYIIEVERGATDLVSYFIVGNKLDLEKQRAVTYEEGSRFAEQIGAAYFETSALNGEGIRKLIIAIAEHLLERQSFPVTDSKSIHLGDINTEQRKKHCCSII